MKKSRLINIFFTLTKKEVRLLRKWLESPFHNQRTDVIALFDYLIKNDHFKKDKYIQKEKVFTVLYPKETYDDAKMRQVMHFLLKIVEDFLTYQELITDDVGAKIALANFYRKQQLNKAFEKTLEKAKQIHTKTSYRDQYYLQNEYKLEQQHYLFLEKQVRRNIPTNLQEMSDALDISFFANKLRQGCLMLSHQKVYKVEYQMGMIEDVIKYVKEKKLVEKFPAIGIYYYIYNLSKKDDHNFQMLKEEISKSTYLFSPSEIRDIYLMAINYCIGKMNLGKEQFIREAFDMYSLGFEKGVLIENSTVSRWTFHNAIVIGFKLKEFDWAEKFINDYQHFIEETYREGFVHYCLARLNFERKNYSQAIKLLKPADYEDVMINLTAKTMLLKIYYEQGNIDPLDALLESTRTYLQRKKVIGYHRDTIKNLLRYTRKLVKVNPYSKTDKNKLREEIKTANPLTEKAWLLEQLDKM